MPEKHVPFVPRRQRMPNYIRQWRQARGLSLEKLAGQVGVSHATISRIERGKQDYTQTLLEMLAAELGTDPVSLLIRDPSDKAAIWSLWDRAQPSQRRMIEEIAHTVLKTGT